jgi:hypothetical protein
MWTFDLDIMWTFDLDIMWTFDLYIMWTFDLYIMWTFVLNCMFFSLKPPPKIHMSVRTIRQLPLYLKLLCLLFQKEQSIRDSFHGISKEVWDNVEAVWLFWLTVSSEIINIGVWDTVEAVWLFWLTVYSEIINIEGWDTV